MVPLSVRVGLVLIVEADLHRVCIHALSRDPSLVAKLEITFTFLGTLFTLTSISSNTQTICIYGCNLYFGMISLVAALVCSVIQVKICCWPCVCVCRIL